MLLAMGTLDLPWLALKAAWWLKLLADIIYLKISMYCDHIDFDVQFSIHPKNLKRNAPQRSSAQHKSAQT
jgi:hypothetical protein